MKNAADAGAKIIVAAGFLQEKAIRDAAAAYPDVHFIFIDGSIEGVDNHRIRSLQGRTGRISCRLCGSYGRI